MSCICTVAAVQGDDTSEICGRFTGACLARVLPIKNRASEKPQKNNLSRSRDVPAAFPPPLPPPGLYLLYFHSDNTENTISPPSCGSLTDVARM